jgi:hypothetical protein
LDVDITLEEYEGRVRNNVAKVRRSTMY